MNIRTTLLFFFIIWIILCSSTSITNRYFSVKHNSNTVLATTTQVTNKINPVCMSSHIDGASRANVDRQTTLMQQVGIKWVRFDVDWFRIEQKKGAYTWADYDYVVNAVTSKGMNVLALMAQYGLPSWERVDSTNWQSPPNNVQDFQTFVQAFATHYKGKISLYEIGNEPNVSIFWPPAPNAQAYTQLLIAGYNGVKTADPTAKVISAGIANTWEPDQTAYINTMYASGAKDHFDYFGSHPYSWPASPDNIQVQPRFSYLDTVHQIMTTNGDGNKQIMVTEVGWPSTTQSNGVTEANQAEYITRLFQKITNENYQYVSIACVYDFIDDGTDKTNPEHNFGMLRTDYSQKPSFSVLQQISQNYIANPTPTLAVSPSAAITTTPSISLGSTQSTNISVIICPHGLDSCGDNANPNGKGNTNPLHQQKTVNVVVASSDKVVLTKQGTITFSATAGNFIGTIDLGNLVSGNYIVSVQVPGYLTKQIPGIQIVTAQKINTLPSVSLVAGDMNNDNQLDILDYNILIGCFGSKANSNSCTNKISADVNDDGIIDGIDYNLFLRELSVQKGQ